METAEWLVGVKQNEWTLDTNIAMWDYDLKFELIKKTVDIPDETAETFNLECTLNFLIKQTQSNWNGHVQDALPWQQTYLYFTGESVCALQIETKTFNISLFCI